MTLHVYRMQWIITTICSMIYLTQHGHWNTTYYIRYFILSNCIILPILYVRMCSLCVQKILKLDLFPDSVFETEMKYYMTKLNEVCSSTGMDYNDCISVAEKIIIIEWQYGIPLDSRSDFTKTDWLMWIAALGDSDQVWQLSLCVYVCVCACMQKWCYYLLCSLTRSLMPCTSLPMKHRTGSHSLTGKQY